MHGLKMINQLAFGGMLLGFAGLALAADQPAVGRWNLMVDTGSYTHPAWLAIEADNGKCVARYLPGAGSVRPIGEVKVDGNDIEFSADGLKWTATIDGDALKGTRVNDKGEKSTWTGERSKPVYDVNGRWNIKPGGVPVEHPAVLTLTQQGSQVSGQFEDRGQKADLQDVKFVDGLLTFKVGIDSQTTRYSFRVRGDILQGRKTGPGRNRVSWVKAYRQREWGAPIELFNGKDLDNWKPLGDANRYGWKVINGIMTNTGQGGWANIVSKETFRDFRAHIEFRVPKNGNSGVYLRGRYEIQVEDSYGKPCSWHHCGSLYSRIAPNVNASKPAGEWQTYDITLVGSYVTVIHNGQVILDNEEIEGITGGMIDSKEAEPGPIYLQGDHGAIEYHKITIWPAQ